MSKLCETSSEINDNETVCPFFTVISAGTNAKRLAWISMVCCWPPAGTTGATATSRAAAITVRAEIFTGIPFHGCFLHRSGISSPEALYQTEGQSHIWVLSLHDGLFLYGARYCSSNFSSSRLSRARTRMCATTVPVMRGLSDIGGMW